VRLRARLKFLLHSLAPGYRGWTSYFGTRLYFGPGSESFRLICEQGIFEGDTVRLAAQLPRQGSVVYDVGANIGQMAAPLLHLRPDLSVVSFEPSPSSVPWLKRSIAESPHRPRWTLIDKAVGDHEGTVDFFLSAPGLSLYEGTVHTARAPAGGMVTAPLTTLDAVWLEQGRPDVSLIKIDTEGGESAVLDGAAALIEACRPSMLVEWNAENLRARDISTEWLLSYCQSKNLSLHAVPSLVEMTSAVLLRAAMTATETFLLAPR